jgi:hypothetical protein
MRRGITLLLIACCLGGLIAACYGQALWGGGQFGYRDAVQYFYPLYARIQAEWRAGRVPLWEPDENAGMPLLGNPSAAVFYPGKVLYALLPYAWAARLYIVAHTVLAFAAMVWLLRGWETSAIGAALAGLTYAFGAPILFQYCNVIYLVGAAWAPLGFRAADRWLRLGRRQGLLELAAVLALIVLGGDAETAYLVIVFAVGYALALSWPRAARPPLIVAALGVILAAGWVLGTLELAARLPAWRMRRPAGLPPSALPWMQWVPGAVLAVWVASLVLSVWHGRTVLRRRLLGLSAAVSLALGLAAVQLFPALEFSQLTDRASIEDPIDVYPFSLEPLRVVELAWPNIFGTGLEGNRSWLEATRPAWAQKTRVWVPSLYLGGLTLALAVGAFGFGGEWPGPARGWLSAVAIVSLVASLGEFTGPLWWARWHPAMAAQVGPHDPPRTVSIRQDGQLRDGDGGVYWLLATALPGFGRFRYPSKLLTCTAFGVAGLAGMGWDRLATGAGAGRSRLTAVVLLAISLAAWLAVTWARPEIVAAMQQRAAALPATMFGPLDVDKAYAALRGGLAHGAVVMAVALGLVSGVSRGGRRAVGALALVVLTADLAVANARLVRTVPQSLLEATPTVVRAIADAERQAAKPGGPGQGPACDPFRVHRMPQWYPAEWERVASADRIREFDAWERDTIAPRYGLLHGIEYTVSSGVAEIDLHAELFGGFRQGADAATAAALGVLRGEPIVVFPRHSFDMWNTRYFVVPAGPGGWNEESRAYAAFVTNAERIYPPPDAFQGSDGPQRRRRWVETRDFQVFRNRAAYPRAWVVHDGHFLAPGVSAGRAERDEALRLILDPGALDPRQMAWLEPESRASLAGYLRGKPPLPSEAPTITHYDPQRVVIDVVLASPGLLILADTFDTGWRLTVDGAAARIFRANQMMRAAALGAGRHHLVFHYEPWSFRIGVAVSGLAIAVLIVFGVRSGRRAPPGLQDTPGAEPLLGAPGPR